MAPPAGVPDVGGSVWSPPSRVDEYHLLRRLGQGGMGTVHLARDTLLDRLVAIKFILAPNPDEVLRQRFQNEARALAKLAHPNVVTIHRVGEIGGRPYIVCELVEGKTLAQLKPPLPASRVLGIGASAARGLAAVHRHGLLHRDIKPANIALMPDGEAKLLDFGLAKIADPAPPPPPDPGSPDSPSSIDATDDWALTGEGRAVGTRAYIAPEIVGGAPASRRSDVYSLGAVLYELCAGYPPSRNVPDRAPASENDALAAVIARCLEEDPELRYRSGDDLREALEELLPGAHEAPVPAGNPYPGLRAFEADERSLFFGRLPESRAVLDRLRSEAIVLVAGDSGVGKSSLCRAGVLPLVADGQLDPARAWRAVTVLPGRRPLLALAAALAVHLGLSEERAADLVRAEPGALGRTLRRRLGGHEALLVFVDQAEELVALADPVEAALVTEALASLGLGPLRVLATVRGDLFTRVAALPGLADALPGALYLLRRLSKPQLREAIVTPALRAGGRFESDALVDTLVDAAADAPGGAALLSFALAELWRRRDPVRQLITEKSLEEVGGVAGALAQHADGLLAGLPAEQRAAVPRLLTRLVTAEGSRARKTAAELDPAGGPGREALEALVRGRLLVAGAADGATAYEIAHEALLVSWSTLRGWLAADAAARARRQRVEAVAAEWKRLGEDPSLLFGARQLYEIDDAELAEPARSFVDASRRAARRKRNGAIAVAVAAALFAGVVYDLVRLQAKHHLADLIAAQRAPAVGALVTATADAAVASALRRGAVARFRDPGEGPGPAAAVWQAALDDSGRARALDALAESDLVSASQALETALLLDPVDGETRRLLAEVTALRLELAERNFQTRERAELRLRLRAYAAGTPLAGRLDADAQLAVVTSPAGATAVLERYQNDSGVLRAVEPVELGATPIAALALAPGSYRLRLEAPGRAPVRYPILLAPGEHLEARVGLPPASAVPAGTIYVPPGRFRFGSADDEGLRRFLMAPPEHEVSTDGYLIGRTEVTFAEYFEFLRDLSPAERAQRLPHAANAIRGTLALEELPGGRFRLSLQPASARYAAVEGEPIRYRGRDRRAEQDWRRFPVAAISWTDARAYVAWLDRTGRLPHARLCTEHEWERAARGADDRIFPHGYRIAPDDADIDVTYGRRPEAYGPDEVGAHPDSESPFGVEDLVGNVWEWTESVQEAGQPSLRGGSYYQEEFTDRVTNRDVGEPDARDPLVGMRVCASLSVAPPL